MRSLRASCLALASLACSGRQRRVPPPPASCAADVRPGLQTRAVTWNGRGWGAVVAEGATLYLRELTLDGEAQGERAELAEEPSTPARVSVAWSNGAYYVAVAPATGASSPRVFRAVAAGASGDAYALNDTLDGDMRVVARPDASGAPAALAYESTGHPWLRILDRDGDPKAPQRCPEGVLPSSVVARGGGFRALVTATDPRTGASSTLDVVALDDECQVEWRTRVWGGVLDGRVHSLAADDVGAVAAFTDRESGVWIAMVDDGGAPRGSATRMERAARAPQVFLQTTDGRARTGVRVVAIRRNEIEDRLERWQLERDGTLRDVRPLTSAVAIEVLFAVGDPWGGGFVGFTRSGLAHGQPGGASRFVFQARICP